MTAYISWNAMSLIPVNHALTFIPSPHVSFRTSRMQKAHHPSIPKVIKLAKFSKWDSLKSIIAMPIKTISNNSLCRDMGIKIYPSLSRNIKK